MTIFRNQAEIALLWVIVAIVWAEYLAGTLTMKYYNRNWYNTIAEHVKGMPPDWVFAVVWMTLYVLIAISIFIFVRDAFVDSVHNAYIDSISLLFIFNMVANKLWTPTFMILQQTAWALFILFIVWLTAVVILVLYAFQDRWISFGTWFAYVLWLTYAFYLNAYFLYVENTYYKNKIWESPSQAGSGRVCENLKNVNVCNNTESTIFSTTTKRKINLGDNIINSL